MCNCKKKALGRFSFDNATVQEVAANGTIQLPLSTDNTSCIESNGGDVTIRGAGTYAISVNVTTIATAAGIEEIQLYRDGTSIPGAHAQQSAAAVGDASSMARERLAAFKKLKQQSARIYEEKCRRATEHGDDVKHLVEVHEWYMGKLAHEEAELSIMIETIR